jgi:hypothetical protein
LFSIPSSWRRGWSLNFLSAMWLVESYFLAVEVAVIVIEVIYCCCVCCRGRVELGDYSCCCCA